MIKLKDLVKEQRVEILKKIQRGVRGLWLIKTSDKKQPYYIGDPSSGLVMDKFSNIKDAKEKLKFYSNPNIWKSDLV
jgi:hypothetical protein